MNRLYYAVLTLTVGACGEAETVSSSGAEAILLHRCAQSATLAPSYYARQGQQLQGLTGQGFVVQGGRLGCAPIDGLTSSAGNLMGTIGSRVLAGADFQGAALRIVSASGVRSEVAVTKIEPDPLDASGQTSLFTLMAIDPVTRAVTNLCTPDAEGRAAAIPLLGSWDQSGASDPNGGLSFNCTSGVVAKCIRWGYRPWQSVNGTSLASYHQACTRMARADYCGNGEPHTEEGTQIDLYDNLGVNTPSQSVSLLFEATWTPQGAYCVSRERWLWLQTVLPIGCQSQFELLLQSSPMNASDLCLMHRKGASSSEVQLSNRTGINIAL